MQRDRTLAAARRAGRPSEERIRAVAEKAGISHDYVNNLLEEEGAQFRDHGGKTR
ncbi:helix-turn-helix domain-containing protein [Streptomyces asiaticus]|uniref:helix-turn-helix domain-containing protein n=1 Tax=Streptomyces asiaticus TaxID=114695 RepID=UPI0034087C1A